MTVHPSSASTRRKTRLQKWLDTEGLTSAQLERVTGIPRQSMTRVRAGADVRQKTMARILQGARALAGRRVSIEELFDFEIDSLESQR